MLSIFPPPTEFSFKTPQNWAFFIWTFSPFFSFFSSFIQQTRPDVSVHCRPGWRLVFTVIFLNILFIFFLLCFVCFSTFSTVKFFCPSVKLVSRFHTPLEKTKKQQVMWFFLFTRSSKWNESTSLSLLQQLWKVIPRHLGHQLNWSPSSGRPPWPDEPAVQPQPHPPKHSRSPNVSNSEHSALLFKRKTLKRINRLTLSILTCASTDLWAERLWGLQHVEQLRVVDLQQHACDLACQAGVHVLDQWKQTLTYWRDT